MAKNEPVTPIIMDAEQARIKNLVDSAPKDAPVIENYEENFNIDPLSVGDDIRKGPEYDYGWLDLHNLHNDLYARSKWAIVSRLNHPHIPYHRWDDKYGGITFKGQNILAFCRKELREKEQKMIVDEFNRKVDRQTEVHGNAKEISPGQSGLVDPGSVGGGYLAQEVEPDAKTDFGET